MNPVVDIVTTQLYKPPHNSRAGTVDEINAGGAGAVPWFPVRERIPQGRVHRGSAGAYSVMGARPLASSALESAGVSVWLALMEPFDEIRRSSSSIFEQLAYTEATPASAGKKVASAKSSQAYT